MKRPQWQRFLIAVLTCLSWEVTVVLSHGQSAFPKEGRSVNSDFAKDGNQDAQIPKGVKAVWYLAKAYRVSTPTRERVCLNGLWKWLPAKNKTDAIPEVGTGWGYIKVPGPWPGVSHWLAKASQTYYPAPNWGKEFDVRTVHMAWYQRTFTLPDNWKGRRICLNIEYLNSSAVVYVNNRKMGEAFFPGGEVDISSACQPGKEYTLTIFILASSFDKYEVSYADAAGETEEEGKVIFRGLCGDVFLESTPPDERITDVKVTPSVRKKQIIIGAELKDLKPGISYSLQCLILDKDQKVLTIKSKPFPSADLRDGRYAFFYFWQTSKPWDTDAAENMYALRLSLLDGNGTVLDTFQPVEFGFREFWIEGRDFRLNGSRIHLFAVPLDCAQISTVTASYTGAKEVLTRLKEIGVNAVYTHNYDCTPGKHLSFGDILKAADDVGMLVAFSLPHVKDYDWSASGTKETERYARHLEWYIRRAQNHPSVVMYVMNHNYTSYKDDQNPDCIDGTVKPQFRGSLGALKRERRTRALEAEAMARRFDNSRPIYHHSSGNLGQMYTLNCYLNFVPWQERGEWFEHWATRGTKPLFLVEYGEPLYSSWSHFRGVLKGKWRDFWDEAMLHQYFFPEWGAQFRGDAAYQVTDKEKENLRYEARQWRAQQAFAHYTYPVRNLEFDAPNLRDVQGEYIAHTWPTFRTWGISGFNLWEYEGCWQLRPGVSTKTVPCPVDWENLQHPGFSPDFSDPLASRGMPYSLKRSDWIPNNRGKAFLRYNQPLFAYIAGKTSRFTSKDHNFYPGETVEKQIIVINDSRRPVECQCQWSIQLQEKREGKIPVRVNGGENVRIPVSFILPETLKPGEYKLTMRAQFENGKVQEDSLCIDVLFPRENTKPSGTIALYDPEGETRKLLTHLGIQFHRVKRDEDLPLSEVLVIGKKALTVGGPGPDLSRVSQGLKVVVFEQTAEVLERRLGFRVQEYGLRRVFKRIPGHPLLTNLASESLSDWRGEATLLPPGIKTRSDPDQFPLTTWCGRTATRPWRCNGYGNVASVLIEKPTCGDFLSIVDGGFGLQYSPLMEYREGDGVIFFCQMDVSGRTENDPAALHLLRNLVHYATTYTPPVRREAVYLGDLAGQRHLEKAGVMVKPYRGGSLHPEQVLIIGPEGGKEPALQKQYLSSWLKGGGHLLALGLTQEEANRFLPFKVTMKTEEHISSSFAPVNQPLFLGIGPADVYCRDARQLPLITDGASAIGNGVLAHGKDVNAVFCQIVPWQFDYEKFYNLKPTFRRASFLLNRLTANMGVSFSTPFLTRFKTPPLPRKKGESLEELMEALWIESSGKTYLLPAIWKGLPLGPEKEPPYGWMDAGFDDRKWREVRVPGMWEDQFKDCVGMDGVFLYRAKTTLPAEVTYGHATLALGRIYHEDWTFVNGKQVGAVTKNVKPQDYWKVLRRYYLPIGTLKEGENIIAIKLNDVGGISGIKGFEVIEDKNRLNRLAAHYGEQMRWLRGLYLDLPVPEDDPYRYFRW